MSETFQRANANGIPLLWREPSTLDESNPVVPRRLVIWLPGFSGSKENCEPQLEELSAAGFVALAFDPLQHGERREQSNEELGARILSNIRRHFWPILSHTSRDVSVIIDWAIENLKIEPRIGMGGVSMGGDIAVAAAGLDQRIVCVAACNATGDWLRPGSHEPPGIPDTAAQKCYDECNPLTHLSHYAHCPAISFQCGAIDTQVPPDGALRFIDALQREYSCGQSVEAVLHEGVAHEFTGAMWRNSLTWFRKYLNNEKLKKHEVIGMNP